MSTQSLRFRTRRMGVVGAAAGVLLTALGLAQVADTESQLKLRMQGYWDAIVAKDPAAAAAFVRPEDRKTFIANAAKNTVESWKLKSMELGEDRTSCKAVTVVAVRLPAFGAQLELAMPNDWVLVQGDWYLSIPAYKDENPMQGFFRGEVQAAGATGALTAPQPRPGPVQDSGKVLLRLKPDRDNPSVVHLGEKALFRYRVVNEGDAPFGIVDARADCHCTAVKLDSKELKPGDAAALEIVFDAFGFVPGPVEKPVQVQFSDSEVPLQFNLFVEIVPNFVLTPPAIDFGAMRPGQQAERRVRILNSSGKAVRLSAYGGQGWGGVDLSVALDRETIDPEQEAGLVVRYRAGSEGEFMSMILLRTDLDREPLVTLRLSGRAER